MGPKRKQTPPKAGALPRQSSGVSKKGRTSTPEEQGREGIVKEEAEKGLRAPGATLSWVLPDVRTADTCGRRERGLQNADGAATYT